jgi:hypothetical protein
MCLGRLTTENVLSTRFSAWSCNFKTFLVRFFEVGYATTVACASTISPIEKSLAIAGTRLTSIRDKYKA